MKMIMAIVANEDNSKVSNQLTKNGFFVTKLATTGGFLMSGNTTLMIVTDDDKVESAIEIIKKCSKKRTKMAASSSSFAFNSGVTLPIEVNLGGATIFILNVEKFEKI